MCTVFIHRTIAEGKIDIESFVELNALLDKLRKTSGYQMCPGIKDFDEILEDVRMQPATVKEELWPWRNVGAKSCKLWHKPRVCFVQRDEAERELDGVCSHRRTGNFLSGGAVNHLPKKFLQVAQIFTKPSNRNDGHTMQQHTTTP